MRNLACFTKTQLLLSYSEALKVYSDLVSRLKDSPSDSGLFHIVEEWRVRAEAERDALFVHVKKHQC